MIDVAPYRHHSGNDEHERRSAGEAVIFVLVVLSVFVIAAWLADKIKR